MCQENALEAGQQQDPRLLGKEALQVPKVACYEGNLPDVEALLDDYKNAKNEDGKYRHLDIMQEYFDSWKGDFESKNSVQTIIRGFYRKTRSELPREKITYDREMLTKTITE